MDGLYIYLNKYVVDNMIDIRRDFIERIERGY